MNAEGIATALGGRRRGRGWKAPCPGHPDQNPSLDLEDRNGKTLLIDRSGQCTNAEIIAALTRMGLWAPSRASQPHRPIVNPFPAEAFHEPTAPSCCFEFPPLCAHWLQFDAEMGVVVLYANLKEAVDELTEKLQRADRPVTVAALHAGIEFSLQFGGIVPSGVDASIVARTIDIVLRGVADG